MYSVYIDLPADLPGVVVLLHVHEEPGPQPRVMDPDSQLLVSVLPSLGYRQRLVEFYRLTTGFQFRYDLM